MRTERVAFPNGNLKKLIRTAWKKSGESWRNSPKIFGINYNTLRSYYAEKTRISVADLEKIEKALGLTNLIQKFGGETIFWSPEQNIDINGSGGPKIGLNKTKLSEPKIMFEKKPEELETNLVSFSTYDIKKQVILPKKIDEYLAEETGIHLGDGFLSGNRYDFRVKGNKNEREYYDKFMKKLYKRLYNFNLNLKEFENTYGFELSSKAIWEFKTKVLKLTAGRKEEIAIPEKFKVNDISVLCGLIRGFFDTDGSIYFRKKYYPVISTTIKSRKLVQDFSEIFNMLGFNAKTYRNKKGYSSLVLYGYANFGRYRKMIGWHNPKQIEKVKKWEKKAKETRLFGDRRPAWLGRRAVDPVTWVQIPAVALRQKT